MSSSNLRVGVDVTTLWASPDVPRDVDSAAVADQPDVHTWLKTMTVEDRLGLHDRTVSQALEGEPVTVVEDAGDWVRVAATWQPALDSDIGYLGWVRRAHLREPLPGDLDVPQSSKRADRVGIAASGRQHLG
ncbi:MAG: hypothetical protein L0H93_13405, partial [Nocardioides sp.]|nr:hypothetical protein [Nocardioides sp.]